MANISEISRNGTTYTIADAPLRDSTATAFSTSSSYAIGDYCLYDGYLYRCKTAIPTGSAWDGTKWDQVIMANVKEDTITGGASSITSSNLTANRALISNASGKVAVSAVTSTELGYLDGVTSNIQTQLNTKQVSGSYKTTQTAVSDPTAGTADTQEFIATITQNTNGVITVTKQPLPSSEASGLSTAKTITALSVTKGKISASASDISIAASQISSGTLGVARGGTGASSFTANRVIISNTSTTGALKVSDITATELSYLDGVTSNIQDQLNAISAGGGKVYASTNAVTITNPVVGELVSLTLTDIITAVPGDTLITKNGHIVKVTSASSGLYAGTYCGRLVVSSISGTTLTLNM